MTWHFEIDVPANGRLHKSTVRVLDDEATKVLFTDKADLNAQKERRRIARNVAARVPEEPAAVEKLLEQAWNEQSTQHQQGTTDKQDVRPESPPPEPADPLKSTPADVRQEAEDLLTDPGLLRGVQNDIAALGVA